MGAADHGSGQLAQTSFSQAEPRASGAFALDGRVRLCYDLDMRKLLLVAVIAIVGFGGYRLYTNRHANPSNNVSAFSYYNLISEVKFDLPAGYQPEDVTYPYGVALYTNLSDEFKKTKSEKDFLAGGGIYVKSMRQIPGTKEIFTTFMKQDFEVKLSQLGKTFTSEMFVTDQGYDAFRTTVSNPNHEVHVVVDTPVAFWFVAQDDTPDFQRVYQSFKPFKVEDAVEVKKAVSVAESFIGDLKSGSYTQAESKMTDSLRTTFPIDTLQATFQPVTNRLNRSLQIFSVQTDGSRAVVRSTLEDSVKNQYAFVSTNLVKGLNDWSVDLFAFNPDSPGLPYETAKDNAKKELKKEDLLKKS